MDRIVGKKAPYFEMNTALGDGSGFENVSLDDYSGKWFVLFFYPLDFTFVCPTEITGFSKRYSEFKDLGADVLAVSVDSQYSHQTWINATKENGGLGKLQFPIASDITKKVSRKYGVLIEEEGISLRGLFVINPEGTIMYSVVDHLNVGRSVDETLRVLQGLQSGGLCPIDWSPGEDML